MYKFLLAAVLAVTLLGSCATTNTDTRTFIEQAVPYVEPATYFACNRLLNLAPSEEDRREKSEIVYAIAGSIRSLSDGQIPTPQELQNLVLLVSPDKAHWTTFAQELGDIYKNLFDRIVNDRDRKTILIILGELAQGCERASQPYVSDSFIFEYKLQYVKPFELSLKKL